jgi:hypothetical protein
MTKLFFLIPFLIISVSAYGQSDNPQPQQSPLDANIKQVYFEEFERGGNEFKIYAAQLDKSCQQLQSVLNENGDDGTHCDHLAAACQDVATQLYDFHLKIDSFRNNVFETNLAEAGSQLEADREATIKELHDFEDEKSRIELAPESEWSPESKSDHERLVMMVNMVQVSVNWHERVKAERDRLADVIVKRNAMLNELSEEYVKEARFYSVAAETLNKVHELVVFYAALANIAQSLNPQVDDHLAQARQESTQVYKELIDLFGPTQEPPSQSQ